MPDDDGSFSELKAENFAPPRVKRKRRPKFKLADVEAALVKSAGVLSGAARILAAAYGSCDRCTVANYIERYPRLLQVVDETTEAVIDLAEHKLISAIDKDHDWAIRFYLETKGKSRGYTKRHEITGSMTARLEVTVDVRERFIAQLVEIGARLGPLPAGDPGAPGEKRPNGADKEPAPAE
jgi:hypothetical protein